jgi:type II secretory pathway component PulF
MMIAAGVTVPNALEHIRANPPSAALRGITTRWLEGLAQGYNVTDSLRRTGSSIPTFDLALMEAAESSGRLDVCFKLLATYYRDRAQIARQMMGDLAYPFLVLNLAIVIFPLIDLVTKGMVNFPRFLWSTLGIAVPVYSLVIIIVYACQGRHGEEWRSLVERVLARIPLLGTARRELALARLATALENLLSGGVPILSAWPLAAMASGSPELNRTVQSWKEPLETGSTPSEMLASSRRFPQLFAQLYRTGEISGTIDDSLRHLHTLFQTEGMAKMRNLSKWTPKLVYFGIILFVAWKVVMAFSAYMNLVNEAAHF